MKALVYKGEGVLKLEERPRPRLLRDTDAIVKVTLASICSSDIHIRHGAVPRAVPDTILGHEFVGVVQEVGAAVKKVKPGDRVAVNVETYCGECFFCKRGYVNNCEDADGGWALGCRIDGGQAEYVRIPHGDMGLTRIPDSVTDEQALFTGDLMSTGYWAAQIGEIQKGDTVLVIGAGPAGICTMMAARLYEPEKIIAVDIEKERLDFVKEQGLAEEVWQPSETDVVKRIRKLTNGRGADVVIEAAGGKDTFSLAWQAARPNAVVGVIAMYEEAQMLPLPDMYGKNLTFKTGGVDGCHCEEILKLIEEGKLNPSCMITHRTSFSNILNAYEIFEKKEDGVLKYAVSFAER